jgi:hypothetical protein
MKKNNVTDTSTDADSYNDLVHIIKLLENDIEKTKKRYYQKGYRAKIKKR